MKKKSLTATEIRRMAYSLSDVISDKEFLQNTGLHRYLESALKSFCYDVRRPISLKAYYDDKKETVACTENTYVEINCGNVLTRGIEGKKNKLLSLLGLVFHEVGHILFTDFVVNRYANELFSKSKWIEDKVPSGAKAMADAMGNPYANSFLLEIRAMISNILEDGYIEMQLNKKFDGIFNDGLEVVNKRMFETRPCPADILSKNMYAAVMNATLSYSKFGEIKLSPGREEESNEEFIGYISAIIPCVDKYKAEKESAMREAIVNEVLSIIFPLLPDVETMESIGKDFEAMKKKMAETEQTIGSMMTKAPESETRPISRIEKGKTEQAISMSDAFTEMSKACLEDAKVHREEKVLGDVAGDAPDEISNVSYHRQAVVTGEDIRKYKAEYTLLKPTADSLVRSVSAILKDREYEGKIKGLPIGKRLDSHRLYRDDGKIFTRKQEPDGIPKLAVGLLVDESGSMDGRKMHIRKRTAIVLEDFLRRMEIEHFILGHTCDSKIDEEMHTIGWDYGNGLAITSYVDEKSYDEKDKYRLMRMCARCNNADGYAFNYAFERLKKCSSINKVLFIITDGEPCAGMYIGAKAEKHCSDVIAAYKKKGIQCIAFGIECSQDSMKRIYGDSYIDVKDLSKLPSDLAKIMKRLAIK